MRVIERIEPFLKQVDIIKLLKNIWEIPFSKEQVEYIKIDLNTEIKEFWIKNPDLRFSQVLVNLEYIYNYIGFWYYIEEDEILKQLNEAKT